MVYTFLGFFTRFLSFSDFEPFYYLLLRVPRCTEEPLVSLLYKLTAQYPQKAKDWYFSNFSKIDQVVCLHSSQARSVCYLALKFDSNLFLNRLVEFSNNSLSVVVLYLLRKFKFDIDPEILIHFLEHAINSSLFSDLANYLILYCDTQFFLHQVVAKLVDDNLAFHLPWHTRLLLRLSYKLPVEQLLDQVFERENLSVEQLNTFLYELYKRLQNDFELLTYFEKKLDSIFKLLQSDFREYNTSLLLDILTRLADTKPFFAFKLSDKQAFLKYAESRDSEIRVSFWKLLLVASFQLSFEDVFTFLNNENETETRFQIYKYLLKIYSLQHPLVLPILNSETSPLVNNWLVQIGIREQEVYTDNDLIELLELLNTSGSDQRAVHFCQIMDCYS